MRLPAGGTGAASPKSEGQEAALLLLEGVGVRGQGIRGRGRWGRGAGRQVVHVEVRGGGRSRFVQEISNTAGWARLADGVLGRVLARVRGRGGERYRWLGGVIDGVGADAATADDHPAHNGTAPQAVAAGGATSAAASAAPTAAAPTAGGNKRFRWRGMHGWANGRLILFDYSDYYSFFDWFGIGFGILVEWREKKNRKVQEKIVISLEMSTKNK